MATSPPGLPSSRRSARRQGDRGSGLGRDAHDHSSAGPGTERPRIIIAPTTSDAGGTRELIRAAKAVGVRVSVLPRMFEVVGSAVEFDDVDGMTMLGCGGSACPDPPGC